MLGDVVQTNLKPQEGLLKPAGEGSQRTGVKGMSTALIMFFIF